VREISGVGDRICCCVLGVFVGGVGDGDGGGGRGGGGGEGLYGTLDGF
jgi:hypothetical protein